MSGSPRQWWARAIFAGVLAGIADEDRPGPDVLAFLRPIAASLRGIDKRNKLAVTHFKDGVR